MPNVYYSICPFGTGDIKTGSPTLTILDGVATLNVAQTGNIGVGCRITYDASEVAYISQINSATSFDLVTATGETPSDEDIAVTVNSIAHEYASLSAFEAGFTDANHIDDTDLTAAGADVNAYACCYYDHDDQTADTSQIRFFSWTVDATHKLIVFTPQGGTESINNQRHSGKWDANKYKLVTTSSGYIIDTREDFVDYIGLQIEYAGVSTGVFGFIFSSFTTAGTINIGYNIIRQTSSATGCRGIFPGNAGITVAMTVNIYNCYVYDWTLSGTRSNDTDYTVNIFNSTYYNNGTYGIRQSNGTVTVKNCAVFANTDDFIGTMTIDYCASDDGGGSFPVTPSNWSDVFVDYTNGDFHLKSTDTDLIGAGTDDPGSGLYSDDIDGETRTSTWDIGADEYIAVGVNAPTAALQGPLFGALGGPI